MGCCKESGCCLCCWTIVFAALFFGLLFGLMYPEIQRAQYIPTTCKMVNTTIVSSYCCSAQCTSCSTIALPAPLCSTLIAETQALDPLLCTGNSSAFDCAESQQCDGGYYCCQTRCLTCFTCGGRRLEDQEPTRNLKGCIPMPYDCDCWCSSSTDHLLCDMECSLCFATETWVTYQTLAGPQDGELISSFGTDLQAANTTLFSFLDTFNDWFVCYYDPGHPSTVILSVAYTPGVVAITSIFGIIPFYIVMTLDFAYILGECRKMDDEPNRMITLVVWASFVPFLIFISIWAQYHLQNALYVSIAFLVFIPGVYGLMWVCDQDCYERKHRAPPPVPTPVPPPPQAREEPYLVAEMIEQGVPVGSIVGQEKGEGGWVDGEDIVAAT